LTASLLGVGVYTISEASRLTKVPGGTISRWLWGYRTRSRGVVSLHAALWEPQLPTIDDSRALGFRDLIEIQFVAHFKEQGVSLQSIRKMIGEATRLVADSYPLSTVKFKTDGKSILAEVLTERERKLVFDLATGQYLLPFVWDRLFDALEYSQYDELLRWWPMGKGRRVLIDPSRSFGQPICPEGVQTSILANSFRSEKTIERVAYWYKVDGDSVRDAIEYESTLHKAA
jgi:uncharacterized protein (DUF433 family)